MARTTEKKERTSAPATMAPPAGFTKRTADRGSGWVLKEKDTIVQGVIQGRFTRADKPDQYYYQIKLAKPCSIQITGGEVIEAKPGELVNLDENAQLRALKDGMDNEQTACWIHFVDKVRQKKDPSKTVWQIEVYTAEETIPF